MQTFRFGRLATEVALLLAVGWAIAVTMIIPKNIFHFHELVMTTYTNGTMDFSTDATVLIRSLGIVSLMTMGLGLLIGVTMGLTPASHSHAKTAMHVQDSEEYEHVLAAAGLMTIIRTPDGATYQLTEHGRRFLRDYAFLDRELIAKEYSTSHC